jgi:hypothetical protein
MTWKTKRAKNRHLNNERIIKKFALFPIKTIYNWKWLETCYIRQERIKIDGYFGSSSYKWINKEFATKHEYDEFLNLVRTCGYSPDDSD